MSFLTVTWTVTAIIHSSTSAPQGAAHSNAGAGCLCDWKTHSVSITGALLTVGRGLSQAAEMKRKLPGWTLFVYECTAGICRRLPLCCSALKTSSPQVSKGWTTEEEDTFFLVFLFWTSTLFRLLWDLNSRVCLSFLFSLRKYKVKTMSPAITISRKRKRRGNDVTLVRRNVTMVAQLFTGSLVSYNFIKLSKCNCKFTGKFLRNTAILTVFSLYYSHELLECQEFPRLVVAVQLNIQKCE